MLNASASECLRAFSAVCWGGAGTTKEVIFVSRSLELLAEECTVNGNKGGAVDFCWGSSDDDDAADAADVCGLVMRLLMIFSSMRARTLTLAVCSGGPVASFFSHFLFSASWKRLPKNVDLLGFLGEVRIPF